MLNTLPRMHFFECGNTYSSEHLGMRYFVARKKDDAKDVFRVTIWPEPWNLDRTPEEKRTVREFPFDDEGLSAAKAWIAEQYDTRLEEWQAARAGEWGL